MFKEKLYIILIRSFWAIIIFVTLLSYNPNNPLVKFNIKKNFSFFLPQGWGFFTKNPKEGLFNVYEINDKGLSQVTINNFTWENSFGLSRKARYIGYEFSKIIPNIPKEAYEKKFGEPGRSYPKVATEIILPFKLRSFPVNKEFVVYQYKLVPYTWMNEGQDKYRPFLQARIKILYSPKSKNKEKGK